MKSLDTVKQFIVFGIIALSAEVSLAEMKTIITDYYQQVCYSTQSIIPKGLKFKSGCHWQKYPLSVGLSNVLCLNSSGSFASDNGYWASDCIVVNREIGAEVRARAVDCPSSFGKAVLELGKLALKGDWNSSACKNARMVTLEESKQIVERERFNVTVKPYLKAVAEKFNVSEDQVTESMVEQYKIDLMTIVPN